MVDLNKAFPLMRLGVFGATTLFAVLAMIMSAVVIDFTTKYFRGRYFIYTALGIATAVLTIFTLPVMLLLSMNRKGAFTSMVVVELVWSGVLWVLWLSTGALVANSGWINFCSEYLGKPAEACMESQAVAAFSFLSWILLMVYFITLLVLAIRLSSNGHANVWTSDVTEIDFNANGTAGHTQNTSPLGTETKFDPALSAQYSGASMSPVTPGYGYQQQVPGVSPTPVVQSVQPAVVSTPSYPQV